MKEVFFLYIDREKTKKKMFIFQVFRLKYKACIYCSKNSVLPKLK